jgi:hypothetical protein
MVLIHGLLPSKAKASMYMFMGLPSVVDLFYIKHILTSNKNGSKVMNQNEKKELGKKSLGEPGCVEKIMVR